MAADAPSAPAAPPSRPPVTAPFNGMATEPVATAASANPLLKTLVAAVTEAGLVDTLNSAEASPSSRPTDDAFAKIPKKDLNALLADKEMLTKVLTHHVIGERSPRGRRRRARDPGRRHGHRQGRGRGLHRR